MLLLHQTGSVKIGEVVRYTVTYTPAQDRILPAPSQLYLRIKNTSAIALRAAFVHGPYTLYVAAYPASFSANAKFDNPRRDGVPEFEPNLKAGGTFSTELKVPEETRRGAGRGTGRNPEYEGRAGVQGGEEDEENQSVTWIVEVSSQVIFSNSAAVHYEILLGRDEKSISVGFGAAMLGNGTAPIPGQVRDHQQSRGAKDGHHAAQSKGVFSRAVTLKVDDTATLWNTPRLPEWDDGGSERAKEGGRDAPVESVVSSERVDEDEKSGGNAQRQRRQTRVHLVVLTHGLHSNLGADMLFLKESIDATARHAKIDARERRRLRKKAQREKETREDAKQNRAEVNEREKEHGETKHPAEQPDNDVDEDEDEEEVIVRGFSGNAARTERGIKYLGKRLAKYVLQMCDHDQPYLPILKRTAAESISQSLKPGVSKQDESSAPAQNHSTATKDLKHESIRAYKITSISFIAHSLGGLVQTYAVAYIQKHSPTFFDVIKPINFIALATPFLGLSNENPLYVKFALDFGLVGRTGQDLGLTWRPPTLARSGWGAIVGGISETAQKKLDGETAPESKPLLRILPTGPAHIVFKKFRNRTVYSNVVNDGIVPLRTSCLLFLDWQGLGRVEKARREIGLVGTMAGWGWAEITGQNSSSPMRKTFSDYGGSDTEDTGANTPTRHGRGEDVPQPSPYATLDDDTRSLKSLSIDRPASTDGNHGSNLASPMTPPISSTDANPFASFFKLFQPNQLSKSTRPTKNNRMYNRSQTIRNDSTYSPPTISAQADSPREERNRGKATAGDADTNDPTHLSAPPKTTFFEAAGDLLKPPLPSIEFLIDPTSRPRTIFHDRVYHPSDIPPPPLKKTTSPLLRRRSSSTNTLPSPTYPSIGSLPHVSSSLSRIDYDDTKHTNPSKSPLDVIDASAMKVEEKIARAYHRDLSWRKVLVRLEPDAHNNMIVRRMFANAYGWPVIKHLCDTHFGDNSVATTRDEDVTGGERAKAADEKPGLDGEEVTDERGASPAVKRLSTVTRTASESREASDIVPDLASAKETTPSSRVLGVNTSTGAGAGFSSSSPIARRPTHERLEIGGWSDHHWADSADESDDLDDELGNGSGSGKGNGNSGLRKAATATAAGGWNWTEVIAGKGAARAGSPKGKVGSPKGTASGEIDSFLGKTVDGEEGVGAGPVIVPSGAAAVASRGLLHGVDKALDASLKTDGS